MKINVDCETGLRGNGLRRSDHAERADAEVMAVTSMSRRALSYSIDNLLATSVNGRDLDNRPAVAASLRLHAISQHRTHSSSSSSLVTLIDKKLKDVMHAEP